MHRCSAKAGAAYGEFDIAGYSDIIISADETLRNPEVLSQWLSAPGLSAVLAGTIDAFEQAQRADAAAVPPLVHLSLYHDLLAASERQLASIPGEIGQNVRLLADRIREMSGPSLKQAFLDVDQAWGRSSVWSTIKLFSPTITEGYFSQCSRYEERCRRRKISR